MFIDWQNTLQYVDLHFLIYKHYHYKKEKQPA